MYDIEHLAARAAITDIIYRYCRGIDRMDKHITKSCFTKDAILRCSGVYEGDVDGFIEWLWPVHEKMVGHSHDITNINMSLTSPTTAVSEAQMTVVLRIEMEGQTYDMLAHGRYLDRLEKTTNGIWLIKHRQHVSHLSNIIPIKTLDFSPLLELHRSPKIPNLQATRNESDPSYGLFHK
jgi:hypothetical protein